MGVVEGLVHLVGRSYYYNGLHNVDGDTFKVGVTDIINISGFIAVSLGERYKLYNMFGLKKLKEY